MKIKNYIFEGFGFPVIFKELPALKVRGELIPDVDFEKYAKPLIEHICARQNIALSGNQVKFVRNYFGLSLREFAKMMNVTHQSVMRWEENKKAAAQMGVNTELVLRIKILKFLKAGAASINEVIDKIDRIEEFESAGHHRKFEPIKFNDDMIAAE